MGQYDRIFQEITARIDGLRVREKKLFLAEGCLWFLGAALVTVLASVTIEALFFLKSGARYALLFSAAFLIVAAFTYWILRPLHSIFFRTGWPDDTRLALKIGEKFDFIRDRLADALQVFQTHGKNTESYSLELADASLGAINQELENVSFSSVADGSGITRSGKAVAVVLSVCFVLTLLFISSFSQASYRLFHPGSDFSDRPAITFEVDPGNAEVVKGENIMVSVRTRGGDLSNLQLQVRRAGASEYESFSMQSTGENAHSFLLETVRDDLEYFVDGRILQSDVFSITAVEIPFVRELQVKVVYPAYSKLGSQLLDQNIGDVAALKGSRVELRAMANKSVEKATIVFDDSTERSLDISGTELRGQFILSRSGTYRLLLQDAKQLKNETPIEYRMTVIEDEFPLVQITFPGQDVDVTEEMMLPITIEVEDDFGFSKARLGYRIIEGGVKEGALKFAELNLPPQHAERLMINHTWELGQIGIFPEDVVTYFAEIFDNDVISGPKSSRSLTYRVRFPSISEIFDEVAKGHEESFESLEEMFEQSKSLRDDLKDIVQQMQREPELNWEEQQKVNESMQAQQGMREQLSELQNKLDEMVSRMEQNDLLSPETLAKYQELQKLMQEMISPEMREALEELQKSLENMDPDQLKEAMEKFSASQEEFLQNVERTLNLLKQLQIEQKLDEAVRRAQDLLRRQNELNEQANQSSSKQDGNKYAQEEKGIRKDTQGLSETLEDLKEKMSEFPRMPQEQIESAQNQAGEQGVQSGMQEAIQQFQSGDMQAAQGTTQQISQDLQEMTEGLQTAKNEMSEQQKQELMQGLSRSAHDLLNLSKQQENLMESTEGMDRNSPGMNDAAEKQQDMSAGLQRVAEQLMELSQQTFFITPELGKAVGKSMSGMEGSLRDLEARNSANSVKNQQQSMSGLNEAVAELRKSMQQMKGSSSAIGFQEMMQRLGGMSKQQQGINQGTSGLGQEPGAMNIEQQAAMQRLAAEQAAVRKSLEELMKEMGGRSDVLGDLSQVSKDMEDVVKELQRQNVSPKTLEQQKRILSRLLDAQRSMHDRDYERRREAETGKQYHALSPDALPSQVLSQKDKLKSELLKAMKEGYSKDYRDLIRRYFEALYEENQKSLTN